jgi:hypothetical protein
MVKSARPLLIAVLLAVVGACAPTNPESAVTPVAALPEAPPPMMVPSIDPPSAPFVAHSAPKRHKVAKGVVKERKIVKKTAKAMKVAKKHHKKKHHSRTAYAPARAKHAATKLASRAKPGPASVPLDSPAPAMRPAPTAPAPSPLSPGLR